MKIISIAAVSGGGKTSLIQKLFQVLPNARALYFDEYDFEQIKYITWRIMEWRLYLFVMDMLNT